MHVIFNDNPIELETAENPTFGDLVEEAERFACDHGKIITQITLNGELITSEDEVTRRLDHCSCTDQINILMDHPRNIIIAALQEADKDIPGLVINLKSVAAHLQTGARRAAFSLFSECIEQWKQVINLFRIAESVLDVDSEALIIEGRTLDHIQSELLELLIETKKSMQEDDAITLSDLLEYELVPNIERQRDVIKCLTDIAEKSCVESK